MSAAVRRDQWTYASGRTAALESRMVDMNFFQNIIQMSDADNMVPRLSETLLGETLNRSDDLREADRAIDEAYREFIVELQGVSPDPLVANLTLWRKDLRSLRNHIKRNYMDVSVSEVPSRWEPAQWDRLWQDLLTPLPPIFGEIVERCQDVAESAESPEMFDAVFDSVSLKVLCDKARETDSEFITNWWQRYDTARGVEFLWRGRALGWDDEAMNLLVRERQDTELFDELSVRELDEWPKLLPSSMEGLDVSGLSSGSGIEKIRSFAQSYDRWLMDYAREARYIAFGPERIFGGLLGLSAESYNMGLAVVGRANQVDPDRLSERMKALYV
ncbi:MAG: V-type ATPase subunit [Planctomycetes bacterium]|nr:V-type ATPase subunit [Planctomycetota bacterium]